MTSPAQHPATAEITGKYLIVVLAGESYGIAAARVREMIRMQPVTPVARTPKSVLGVINLRGRVIPVIDLRLRLGLSAAITETTCIVVVQIPGAAGRTIQMGLVVDAVEEVLNVPAGQIEPPPDFGLQAAARHTLGMASIRNRVVTLLAIDQVVSGDAPDAAAGPEPPAASPS